MEGQTHEVGEMVLDNRAIYFRYNAVKLRRKKLRLTQQDLAERAGVGLRFIRDYRFSYISEYLSMQNCQPISKAYRSRIICSVEDNNTNESYLILQ